MNLDERLRSVNVAGVPVHVLSVESATAQVCAWAAARESRYVCASNVHMLMEAHDDRRFREVLTAADLVTADGMPVVWGQKLLGRAAEGTRVYGPDLTLGVCAAAAAAGLPVGFYGGSEPTLDRLVATLQARFPRLQVAFSYSPPFRQLSDDEDAAIVDRIRASGARVLFVGLGCPKQEAWMARRRGRIPAVMLGVGAAFDFIAGTKSQAPSWMQRAGLEWTFRLATEPRRLWRRYLYHNPRFVLLLLRQAIASRARLAPPRSSVS